MNVTSIVMSESDERMYPNHSTVSTPPDKSALASDGAAIVPLYDDAPAPATVSAAGDNAASAAAVVPVPAKARQETSPLRATPPLELSAVPGGHAVHVVDPTRNLPDPHVVAVGVGGEGAGGEGAGADGVGAETVQVAPAPLTVPLQVVHCDAPYCGL